MIIYLQYALGNEPRHESDAVFEAFHLEPLGEVDYLDVQHAVLSALRGRFTQSNNVRVWVSQCEGEQLRELWHTLRHYVVEMWRDHEDFAGLLFLARDDHSTTEAAGYFVRDGIIYSFNGTVGVDEGITINEHPPIVRLSLEDAERQLEERERAEQEAERLHAEMMSELDRIDWIREGF